MSEVRGAGQSHHCEMSCSMQHQLLSPCILLSASLMAPMAPASSCRALCRDSSSLCRMAPRACTMACQRRRESTGHTGAGGLCAVALDIAATHASSAPSPARFRGQELLVAAPQALYSAGKQRAPTRSSTHLNARHSCLLYKQGDKDEAPQALSPRQCDDRVQVPAQRDRGEGLGGGGSGFPYTLWDPLSPWNKTTPDSRASYLHPVQKGAGTEGNRSALV